MSRVHSPCSGLLPASQGFLRVRLGVLAGVRATLNSKCLRREAEWRQVSLLNKGSHQAQRLLVLLGPVLPMALPALGFPAPGVGIPSQPELQLLSSPLG